MLLAATIMSGLPHSPLALVLLLAILFINQRPLLPRLNMAITVATIFLMPLILAPLQGYLTYTWLLPLTVVQIITATSIFPAIYLLDCDLRQNAQKITPFITGIPKRRHITTVPTTLAASTLILLLVSVIFNNPVLLFTSITFALYLLAILIRVVLAIPRLPFDVHPLRKRIIAGTTASVFPYVTSKTSIKLYSLLSPADSWVKAAPLRFTLSRDKAELKITITPPLAGPAHPQIQASVMDSRGFIQVNQLLEPVELHVIPRAKYAEWLAIKYLEHTGAGAGIAPTTLKRGIEYFDSRTYQPGDQLKDIDWKHTLKLSRLIVKEYVAAGGNTAIIAVNLSATDAEGVDKTAFNLITSALTLAHEAIPTALAVYNHQRVILTTAVIDPRKILKQTLSLIKDITPVEFTHRYLQSPDLSRLRRDIVQLKQTTTGPAQRLLSLLNFEYQAIEKAAKNHPATLALSTAIRHAPTPVTIALISQMNHDAEALMVTTEKLPTGEFTTIPMATK